MNSCLSSCIWSVHESAKQRRIIDGPSSLGRSLSHMAKPINSIEEILLLRPGASLEGLEAEPSDHLVREFQRILGGGELCDEVDVFDPAGAERWKQDLPISDALEFIDNRSGLNAKTASALWPVFSHGDGHTFYY